MHKAEEKAMAPRRPNVKGIGSEAVMRVLVNAGPMTGLLTGVARLLRNLYSAMACLGTVELTYKSGYNLTRQMPVLADQNRCRRLLETIWKFPNFLVFNLRGLHWLIHESSLRYMASRRSFELYHETATTPSRLPTIPAVYSVYDLSLCRLGATHIKERVWFFKLFFERRLAFVSHILTCSEFIRRELIELFGLPPGLVSVVPLASDPVFGPRSDEQVARVRRFYRLPWKYLLFVGTLEPRKNIDRLLQALQICSVDIPLVLAGWRGWQNRGRMQNKAVKNVYFTGHVPDADLVCLYNGATALVYPSIYEGFGLPILEAMACGCPVICSDTASMPEVAGDAALLVNPFDVEALAHALETIITDTELRQTKSAMGYQQAAQFSWRQSAQQVAEIFAGVHRK
jgi:alpha-1,3-rhamnosyl/mannosyltransferase